MKKITFSLKRAGAVTAIGSAAPALGQHKRARVDDDGSNPHSLANGTPCAAPISAPHPAGSVSSFLSNDFPASAPVAPAAYLNGSAAQTQTDALAAAATAAAAAPEDDAIKRRLARLDAWKSRQGASSDPAPLAALEAPPKPISLSVGVSARGGGGTATTLQHSMVSFEDDDVSVDDRAGAASSTSTRARPLPLLSSFVDDDATAPPASSASSHEVDALDAFLDSMNSTEVEQAHAAVATSRGPDIGSVSLEDIEKLSSSEASGPTAVVAASVGEATTSGGVIIARAEGVSGTAMTAGGATSVRNASSEQLSMLVELSPDEEDGDTAGGTGGATTSSLAEEEEYRRQFIASLSSKAAPIGGSLQPQNDATASVAATDSGTTLHLVNGEAGANVASSSAAISSASDGAPGSAAAAASAPAVDEDAAELALLARDADDEEAKMYMGAEWEGSSASALEVYQSKLKAKLIPDVDHSKIDYEPIRKQFYIEPRDVASLTNAEVHELRDDLEIKLRGKNVPRPLSTWDQTGLPDAVLNHLASRGFAAPFAIQKQALPVIMSGRDIIGVAKTGSGKTLAYLLPMLRHVMDQRPVAQGEGPIALIMAPSRELVTQIFSEARKLARVVNLRAAVVYGGSPIAEQIAELKRGAEIVVCTPGRMIELLAMREGRMLSMSRVSFLVLDEADRMFDMGFEPQINKIVGNARPDRQTLLFSATFPHTVESLARKALKFAPVEIVVGGRSMASADISQWVEVLPEGEKYLRLLQLLGEWTETGGSIIVFVDTKEHCDGLYADLAKAGYGASVLSLHGGKDQEDRDQALIDFKSGERTILLATGVAGRGLDVPSVSLVVNYSVPNHLEEYVHRVGRTGRAGRKGTAYTFVSANEAQFAPDLMRALKDAKQEDHISPELRELVAGFNALVAAGEAKRHRSGYTGVKGFKFDGSEVTGAAAARDAQRRSYELGAGIKTIEDIVAEEGEKRREREQAEALDEEAEVEREYRGRGKSGAAGAAAAAAPSPVTASSGGDGAEYASAAAAPAVANDGGAAASSAATSGDTEGGAPSTAAPPPPAMIRVPADAAKLAVLRAKVQSAKFSAMAGMGTAADVERAEAELADVTAHGLLVAAPPDPGAAAAAARAAAAAAALITRSLGISSTVGGSGASNPSEELEINDYPEKARKRMFREGLPQVRESYADVTVTTKGVHVEAGRKPPPGLRKLYVLIDGQTELAVRNAKKALVQILEEETLRAGLSLDRGGGGGGGGYGKYNA